jgi:hypothetical protein
MRPRNPIKDKSKKKPQKKFSIIQNFKTKQITIKRMRIKFGIKIKWYKTVSDEIEKQNKSRKGLKK